MYNNYIRVMSIYSQARYARIKAQIVTKEAQLIKANETYESLLSNEVDDFKFDSGEGSQRSHRRNLNELKKQIDSLESQIENLYRRIQTSGLVNIVLRRK